jgi:hypothetical protein
MRGSWLWVLVSVTLPMVGCHDLDAVSKDRDDSAGGTGGSGGTSGSSGSGGDGGGGSGGDGGGGDGGGGDGGSGGTPAVVCSGQRCADLDSNPLGGELCCTEFGTGTIDDSLELAGREEDVCGVRLDSSDSSFDSTCWQLDQPGSVDFECPEYASTGYGILPGCCTDEGYCGVQFDEVGVGCTYAVQNVVGHPCGSNPIAGCHPTEGPSCSGPSETCRPIFIGERGVATWGCIDSFMLPGDPVAGGIGGYPQNYDCSSGWVQVSTPGGDVAADPCGPGLVCVNEIKRAGGWSCQPYCDENLPCASGNERCRSYNDPQGFDMVLSSCDPTESCILGGSGGLLPPGANCPVDQSCYLSYDWFALHAHDQCFDSSTGLGTSVGDECSTLDSCPPNAVCIGPLGVPPSDWGDGDPAHVFRCTEICSSPAGSTPCPTSCTSLENWDMDPYDDIFSRYSVSLCPLPAPGAGGSGGSGGSGASGSGGEGG